MYNLNSTFEDSTDGGQTHPLHEVEESNMLKSSWSLSTGKNPCLHVNKSKKRKGYWLQIIEKDVIYKCKPTIPHQQAQSA